MSSPPLPAAPLAERLAWLAAEAREDKAEVGMIAAALIEVFARLLTCLAGFAARTAAGTLPEAQPRATPSRAITAPAAALAAPGLLPRVLGWLGGLPPMGGAIALPPDIPRPQAEQPRSRSASPWIASRPRPGTPAGAEDLRPEDTDAGVAAPEAAWVQVPPSGLAGPAWIEVPLAAWRRLPASTAGPCFSKRGYPPPPKHDYFVTISKQIGLRAIARRLEPVRATCDCRRMVRAELG